MFVTKSLLEQQRAHIMRSKHFPALEGFSTKEQALISKLYRWYAHYCEITRAPITAPTGTLCELVLMLDLIAGAVLDYSVSEDMQDKMYELRLSGGVEHNARKLKNKAWSLFEHRSNTVRKPEENKTKTDEPEWRVWPTPPRVMVSVLTVPVPQGIPREMAHSLNKIFRWFSAYRCVQHCRFPRPSGTVCEIVMMLELVQAALLHCTWCERTRKAIAGVAEQPLASAIRQMQATIVMGASVHMS
jgi:hypothetical protein